MRFALRLIAMLRNFFSRQEICLEKRLWQSIFTASGGCADHSSHRPRHLRSLDLTALKHE